MGAVAGAQAGLAVNESPVRITRELVYCRFPLLDGRGNPPRLVRAAVDTVAGLLRAGTPTLVYWSGEAVAQLRDCSLAEGLALVLRSGPADVSPGLLSEVRGMPASEGSFPEEKERFGEGPRLAHAPGRSFMARA